MERSTKRRLFAGDQRVPDGEHGLVEVVDCLLTECRDLLRVPVALEVLVALPDGRLAEVQRVIRVARQRPALRPERHRPGGSGLPYLVPALRPERVDMPLDVDDLERAVARCIRHQAPHSQTAATNTAAESTVAALMRRPRPGSPPGPPPPCRP